MEDSVEEKIQKAIQPLVDRIAVLQTENLQFRKDIVGLQTATQSKIATKPGTSATRKGYKPLENHSERPITAKSNKRLSEHQQIKPQHKPLVRPGSKKQEPKIQHQDNKAENGKANGAKPTTGSKVPPSPNANKDDKNVKNPRPSTAVGGKPTPGTVNNRNNLNDKKPVHTKNSQVQLEKKQEGELKSIEKKSHTSKDKEQKPTSAQGLKSPVGVKGKPSEKKIPVSIPSPAPSKKTPIAKPEPKSYGPIKGGKPIQKSEKKQEVLKQEIKQETIQKQEPIPDQIKVEMKEEQIKKDEDIPDAIVEQSIALNNPYTPNQQSPEKKETESKKEVNETHNDPAVEQEKPVIEQQKKKQVNAVQGQEVEESF